jgi:hypothetical protein
LEHTFFRGSWEIGARLGVRVGTVATRLFRIKLKLRAILQRVYRLRLLGLRAAP